MAETNDPLLDAMLALAVLTPIQRETLVDHDVLGHTFRELGRRYDRHPQGVHKTYVRARANLDRHLAEVAT